VRADTPAAERAERARQHLRLGKPVLARVDLRVATLLVLAPLGLHDLLGLPSSVQDGITLFIGISLLVAVAIGYGGCEVIATSTAAVGRRYVVHCPYDAVDAAERPLRSPPPQPPARAGACDRPRGRRLVSPAGPDPRAARRRPARWRPVGAAAPDPGRASGRRCRALAEASSDPAR
jgi:Family of unknown function (DUF6410)